MTREDGELRPALNRLEDAVSALIDPRPEVVDGKTRWTPSLYEQLRDSLPGQQSQGGRNSPNMGGAWIDCLLIVMQIDDTVSCWQRAGADTPARLQLIETRWATTGRPQDVKSIDQISGILESWVSDIRNLLNPEPKLTPRVPCPECGEKWIHSRDSGGDLVRRPALHITGEGCRCGHCRILWTPAQWGLLERRIKNENFDLMNADTPGE
jgi:hypothetical protein